MKTAIITGASSGIGVALADELAAKGRSRRASGQTQGAADEHVDRMKSAGHQAMASS